MYKCTWNDFQVIEYFMEYWERTCDSWPGVGNLFMLEGRINLAVIK
jgi:hypothetical protein